MGRLRLRVRLGWGLSSPPSSEREAASGKYTDVFSHFDQHRLRPALLRDQRSRAARRPASKLAGAAGTQHVGRGDADADVASTLVENVRAPRWPATAHRPVFRGRAPGRPGAAAGKAPLVPAWS